MKNAYALGVSLMVGLEKRDGKIGSQHYNSQAALFGQSVKEMTRLLELIGGKPENIIHGAGDLYVTIFAEELVNWNFIRKRSFFSVKQWQSYRSTIRVHLFPQERQER